MSSSTAARKNAAEGRPGSHQTGHGPAPDPPHNAGPVPVERLGDPPYRDILGYPRAGPDSAAAVMDEMAELGVGSVSFQGGVRLGSLRVLGKGTAGVVVLVRAAPGRAALKIRRSDSPRADMRGEADMLRGANLQGVGPRLLGHTKNCILMERIEGVNLGEWLRGLGPGDAAALKNTVRSILCDCRALDRAGLDHGELVRLSKHVVVGEGATIVDFEGASRLRRASNVTAAAQGLYLGGLARSVGRVCGAPPREAALGALRAYKANPTGESFGALLRALDLE